MASSLLDHCCLTNTKNGDFTSKNDEEAKSGCHKLKLGRPEPDLATRIRRRGWPGGCYYRAGGIERCPRTLNMNAPRSSMGLSSPACIGDGRAGGGMYGGTGNIYAGKKRWNAVPPSAALTKTSLFLPAGCRDLCPLACLECPRIVQEKERERGIRMELAQVREPGMPWRDSSRCV